MNRAELAAAYIEKIGYDPFADDPSITEAEVAKILAELDQIEFNADWEARIDVAARAGNETEVERLMAEWDEAFKKRFPH